MPKTKFDVFTYQMSPVSVEQLDFFVSQPTAEERMKLKNNLLFDVVAEGLVIYHRKYKLNYRVEYMEPEFMVLRLANKKSVSIEKQFHRETFESEPSCLVAIYNDPEIQIIAIESDKTSFATSFTVAKLLQRSMERGLKNFGLKIAVKPKYEEKEFWDLVDRYAGEIEKLRFEFQYPNLGKVNRTLSDDLKEASRSMGSDTTRVEFNAAEDEVLKNIDPENQELSGLVRASAEGAGPAKIKMKGRRSWESTENKVKFTEYWEMEASGPPSAIKDYIEGFKDNLRNV
jgi:hypothetical protein